MFWLKTHKRLMFSKLQMCIIGFAGALIWEIHSAFCLYNSTLPTKFLDALVWVFIVAMAGTIIVFFINKVLLLFITVTGQKFAWLSGLFIGTIIGIFFGIMDIFSVWFCGNIDGLSMVLGNFPYLFGSMFIWACCGVLLAFTIPFRVTEKLS